MRLARASPSSRGRLLGHGDTATRGFVGPKRDFPSRSRARVRICAGPQPRSYQVCLLRQEHQAFQHTAGGSGGQIDNVILFLSLRGDGCGDGGPGPGAMGIRKPSVSVSMAPPPFSRGTLFEIETTVGLTCLGGEACRAALRSGVMSSGRLVDETERLGAPLSGCPK